MSPGGQVKIYIAHNFVARNILRETIKNLETLGHEVTSTWITDDSHLEHKNARQSAIEDLMDIDRADALILFVEQFGDSHGRGKYIEFGYAIAKRKKVYIYGSNPGCIFYNLPEVHQLYRFSDL